MLTILILPMAALTVLLLLLPVNLLPSVAQYAIQSAFGPVSQLLRTCEKVGGVEHSTVLGDLLLFLPSLLNGLTQFLGFSPPNDPKVTDKRCAVCAL
jgi:hypothetical protein